MNQTLLGRDFRLDAPLLTRPVVPDITAPFAALFHAVDALREPGRSLVVLFAGAGVEEGATAAVASGFARTTERANGLPLLFIDATGDVDPRGSDLREALRCDRAPREAALPTIDPGIAWASLGRSPLLSAPDAARLLAAARDGFASVVIDAGGLAGGVAASALARHCDGTILVARSGRTEAAALGIGRVAIERAGGHVLGAVIDGEAERLPRFLANRL